MKNKLVPKTRLLGAALSATLLFGLVACSDSNGDSNAEIGTKDNPIRVGVVGSADDHWPIFEEKAEAAGIYVELKDFSDYNQPNPALTDKELDLNQFQHLLYLANYNVSADEDLTPIGATAVYPLGVYSSKYKDVKDIPAGSQVAIPNDPTNLSRSLLVLQDAGLVKLRDGGSAFSTEADVLKDGSKVEVVAVDAAQTAVALASGSVAASVINNDFVADAGLDPKDAIYQDDADSDAARPYINVWVARAAEKDNAKFKKLVEIFHDSEVTDALLASSGGSAVIANQSADELAGYLKDIQADLEANS